MKKLVWFIKRLKWIKSIHHSVRISGIATIGSNCHINRHSVIGDNAVLGDSVQVGSYSVLEKATVGKGSAIESYVICTGSNGGNITIGENCYIGLNNILDHSDNISIGNYVHIAGPSTGLWTHSSYLMCLNSVNIIDSTTETRPTAPIVIEDNVYIGGNCTIYPGIRIGHHSIVAPNSAVTKDVPPYSMVGGVPAKFIKDTHDMITVSEKQPVNC